MQKLLVVILIIITDFFVNIVVYAKPNVSNLITPVTYFINHVTQLNALDSNLYKYKKMGVVGTSGIGKTQIARMYAYENQDRYDLIWFFDCNLSLNNEFLKLAKAINASANKQLVQEDLVKAKNEVMDYLSAKDKWLLVFDNNKTKGNIKIKEFIELETNGNIIFCSQDSNRLPYVIKMKEFSQKDSMTLAKSILGNNSSKEINFLAKEFKGYPVLIVQGAQILSNIKGLSNNTYKKMIQDTDNKIKVNIKLCMQELTPTANALLKRIALINNQSFSKLFLSMITNSKETLDDDIYQLSRFVLISNTNHDENNPLFEMHDAIAKTVQEINEREQNKKYLEEMISNILVKSFPKGVTKRHILRTSSTINENLQIMLENAERFNIDLFKNLELRSELFGTSANNGDNKISEEMISWFEEREKNKEFDLKKMNNHERYVYALYMDLIGYCHITALSEPVKAIDYFTQAKEIAKTINGYEYMKFNVNYQLFGALLILGKTEDAQKTMEEISKIYETGLKHNNIEELEVTYLYDAKIQLFLEQEKYEDALNICNKDLALLKQYNFKETDMFLGVAYQQKIDILNYLKKHQEAYSLAKWLYDKSIPYLNLNHETIAKIYTKMAIAQYGLKDYQGALENADKAIEVVIKVRNIDPKKIQFTNDRQLARTLIIKADCLSALGFIEEALEAYEKAEALHNNIYVEHLDSSMSLRYILFEATKTACKKPSELNKFWYKHFYGNLRSVFGIDSREVKEIERICHGFNT